MNGVYQRFQKDEKLCSLRNTCDQCDAVMEEVSPHIWEKHVCTNCGCIKDQHVVLTELVLDFKAKCFDLVATEVDKLLVALKPEGTKVD